MARALRCGIVAAALLAVAACGPGTRTAGSTPSPSASPSAVPTIGTTPTGGAAGPAACQTSQLSLSTGQHTAGAGTVQEVFILTNTGQGSCTLYGYPGMQMMSGGRQIPTRVVRTQASEQTVTLAPGGTSSFMAQWHDQTGYTTACATSQQVQVTPPDTSSQLTVAASIQACPDGTINVTPVTAGSTGGQ
ncbi:MAG: DUF4232 domain-containing protein [Candidatus Dormibacteraeota bacterium]|nr:DUF4232 domain-containing protein [Candidatus Dormibacteraeota bacterium]MBO0746401.1 DUF4232 domain-containing protein [Candidatus Dormibacteraeota bacterium]